MGLSFLLLVGLVYVALAGYSDFAMEIRSADRHTRLSAWRYSFVLLAVLAVILHNLVVALQRRRAF